VGLKWNSDWNFYYFFIVLGGEHCGIYKSSYNLSNISYLYSPPAPILYYPPTPIHGIVSKAIIFPFTYMCTQYLHNIHPPVPFPHHFLPPSSTSMTKWIQQMREFYMVYVLNFLWH
jgi:hypothetical protein